MKAPYLTLAFLVLFSASLSCQKDRVRIYELKAVMLNGQKPVMGYLAELQDSTIWISPEIYVRSSAYWKLPAADIESLKFRRKGSVGRGLLIGGLSGLAAGAIIGLASGSDDKDECNYVTIAGSPVCFSRINPGLSASEKAVVYGLGTGTVGMLVGVIIGASRITIPLNGNVRTYRNQKERLRKYQITVPQQ